MGQNELRLVLKISVTTSKRVTTHGNGHKFSNEEITHVQGPILSIIHITKVCKK